MGEQFVPPMPPNSPEAKKEEDEKIDPIKFTYPDGSVGTAKTRMEAADKMEEYREGSK